MDAVRIASDLISFDSVSTNSNAPVSDYCQQLLTELGFDIERIEYEDEEGVRKVSVVGRRGEGAGGLAYFGHTDVVPVTSWFSDEHGPFTPHVTDGRLYGRGAADMKGSVAAMISAAARMVDRQPQRPLYIACTADEEIGYQGAQAVISRSQFYRELVAGDAVAIIGEPTRLQAVHAHKGGCRFTVTSRGEAAHTSTGRGLNANLAMIPFLVEMKQLGEQIMQDPAWHNKLFTPPHVCWNLGINDHTEAVNITPPQSICTVAFRPMPGQNARPVAEQAHRKAEELGLEFHLDGDIPPFFVEADSPFMQELLQRLGQEKAETVAFGSEAGQYQEIAKRVLLGPGDIAQAHTIDEWIAVEQLERGTDVFARLIDHYCCADA